MNKNEIKTCIDFGGYCEIELCDNKVTARIITVDYDKSVAVVEIDRYGFRERTADFVPFENIYPQRDPKNTNDYFIVDGDRVSYFYYNADSCAGGAFVENVCWDKTLLKELIEKCDNLNEFFDLFYSDDVSREYYYDKGSKYFENYRDDFDKKMFHGDFIEIDNAEYLTKGDTKYFDNVKNLLFKEVYHYFD